MGTEERADRIAVSQAESRLRRGSFPGGVGPLHPVGEEAGLPHHGQSWANPPAASSCSPERGFAQERRGDSGLWLEHRDMQDGAALASRRCSARG